MAILIAAATAKELSALLPGHKIAELQPARIKLRQREAILIATGVGIINAALGLGLCFGLTHESTGSPIKISAVIYAGLAGAFDLEKTPLCSIWRVNREIWPEYGLHDGTRVTARAFSHPLWERENAETVYDELPLDQFTAIPGLGAREDLWPACASLTVSGVTASFARREALWNFWHAELENMEGFAAAYVAARASVPVVEIRVVSNKVGPRRKDEKDFEGALSTLGTILPTLGLQE